MQQNDVRIVKYNSYILSNVIDLYFVFCYQFIIEANWEVLCLPTKLN